MSAPPWHIEASPAVTAPGEAAQRLLREIDDLRPGTDEATIRRRLEGRGTMMRWRPHRLAYLLGESAVGPAHVKVYAPRDAIELAIELVTPARALTSWKMGRAMHAAGIPTPDPLLLLLRKPWRIHRESVLVVPPLENPVDFSTELKTHLAGKRSIRPMLDRVAALAAAIHRAGFMHGDFTTGNVMIAGPPDRRELFIIDLDRAKSVAWLPEPVRRRIQLLDLRLLLLTSWAEVTRPQWLRLLARYFRALGLSRARRRSYARFVLSARRGRIRLGAAVPPEAGRIPWAQTRS